MSRKREPFERKRERGQSRRMGGPARGQHQHLISLSFRAFALPCKERVIAKAEPLGQRHPQALLQRILYWTGGHPYLTQRLCQAVAADASGSDASGVDCLCRELFLSAEAREKDDNLLFVR